MEGHNNDHSNSPMKISDEGIGSGDTGGLKAKIQEKHLTNGSDKPTNGVSNHVDRDKHSSSSKHHSSSSSSSKHKDGSSHKHRDGHSSSSSKEGHKSSSSSKHSSSSSSSKHRDGSSSHSKDKHSSSSSSKPGSSSSSDKHKSSSSNDKHKDKQSSSSDKHKERSKDGSSKSSSSSKDKHRDDKHRSDKHKHKDRHKDSSSKDKHRSDSDREKKDGSSIKIKEEKKDHSSPVKIKEEKRDHSPTKLMSPKIGSPASSSGIKSPRSDSEKAMRSPEIKPKTENISDDEDKVALSATVKTEALKRKHDYSSDDEPLSSRAEKVKKKKKDVKVAKKRKGDDEDFKQVSSAKKAKKDKKKGGSVSSATESPKKKVKKEEEQEVWKWWEEEKKDDGVKWKTLQHQGPVFAPDYEPLPDHVKFYYDGKPMKLSLETEEVATFYGRMLDHDYTSKDVFNTNFFKDWKKVMTREEKEKITDLKKCNFNEINDYFKQKSEERKAMTKEQKQEIKKANEKITEEYGFCIIDGHKEKIGNFRIEPPGLFRGRGEHPKQGMLKKRVLAEDVIINCGKDSVIPVPPPGHKWKEVRHDNQVTWLASWNENIQGQTKYIMLNAASKLKGEKDWAKYEVARKLHKCVDKIRANYHEDFKSKEMRIRQRAVALYFIDKLALRAGNEKEEGETADTVGCCSLRVEHTKLYEEKEGKPYVVEFDFLGKDSIRYNNSIPVEKRVFKNLELFTQNKQPSDDLFDRLNTAILNKHLHDLMEGLTAKVFRTYNASRTLQEQLNLLTNPDDSVAAKILSYNRANRAVAVLCNHQRAVPKTFAKSMQNMMTKIEDKKKTIQEAKRGVKEAKSDFKQSKTDKNRNNLERKKKLLQRLEEQLQKLEVAATDRDENKDIALGTSKLNYLDPRISVAWCKKFDVPVEKIYNKTQRDKFRWAIDMATADFTF